MDDAAELAARGRSHGTVIVAEEQKAGRGRHGRTWESTRSLGLYIAVILDENISGDPSSLMSLICGLAVCETVRGASVPEAGVKWPNDVLAGERKIAGILVSKKPADGVYIVGVGINVHHRKDDFTPELQGKATSIYLETGSDVSRNEVAGSLVRNLFEKNSAFINEGPLPVIEEYRGLCSILGEQIEITEADGVFKGIAEDIAADGALLVRIGSEIKAFYSGDVSIKR